MVKHTRTIELKQCPINLAAQCSPNNECVHCESFYQHVIDESRKAVSKVLTKLEWKIENQFQEYKSWMNISPITIDKKKLIEAIHKLKEL